MNFQANPRTAGTQLFGPRVPPNATTDSPWSASPRDELLRTIVESLNSGAAWGVAIIGGTGMGKTSLLEQAQKQLSTSHQVLKLHNESELVEGTESADARPVLFILDEPSDFGPQALARLMHRVLAERARVIITTQNLRDLPTDLRRLRSDGHLIHVQLRPLTLPECRKILSDTLDAPVSTAAALSLLRASAGNPLAFDVLLRDQLASGNIYKLRETWVLRDAVLAEQSESLAQMVAQRYALSDQKLRGWISTVALLSPSPLDVVASIIGEDAVNELEKSGFAVIERDPDLSIRLTSPYLAIVARQWLPLEKKQEIVTSLFGRYKLNDESINHSDLVNLARWASRASLDLDMSTKYLLAQAAWLNAEAELVLELTDQRPESQSLNLSRARMRSAAFRTLSEYQLSMKEIDFVSANQVSQFDVGDYLAWATSMIYALLWVPESDERIADIVAEANRRKSKSTRVSAEKSAEWLDFELARLSALVHLGCFEEAIPALQAGYKAFPRQHFGLNCAAQLVSALTATGRELDAIHLAHEVIDKTKALKVRLVLPQTPALSLFLALMWSGQWRECVREIERLLVTDPDFIESIGGGIELIYGLANIYAGRGQAVIALLRTSIEQLEAKDAFNSLPLAFSGLALAHAQIAQTQEAEDNLAAAESGRDTTTMWILESAATFCYLMARKWLGDEAAVEKLKSLASEDMEQGRTTTASMHMFGGSINGTEEDFKLLIQASSRRQGPMGELNRRLGQACLDRDSEAALKAAKLAKSLELAAVESRCMVVAMEFARAEGDMRTLHKTNLDLQTLAQTLPALPVKPLVLGTKQTKRESQVTMLAVAGKSNSEIAEELGLSVRTVEGHLYQAFATLGITSRVELEHAVASENW